MLRAASGRLPRYAIQQRFHSRPSIAEPLLLPFLCPAISTSSRWLRNSSTDAAADTNPTSTARPPAYSTVPFPDLLPSLDGDFAKTNGMDVFGTQQNETSGAQPPEANLVIVDTPVLRDTVRRKARMVAGISENKHEVLATFEACIRVGRIARAQLMLTVITNQFDRKSPLLIRAHNMFLKALLGRAVAEKSHYSDGLRVFFSWYQDKMMRELGLTGDATTFAFLLEASVLVAIDDPPLGKRYMVEYVEMWKGLGRDIMRVFDLNILPGNHIITVAQVRHIQHLCASNMY